jgi:hypothetical protein
MVSFTMTTEKGPLTAEKEAVDSKASLDKAEKK